MSGIVLLQPASSALGNGVTFPEPTPISTSGSNFPGAGAFNVIDRTWLVIWEEVGAGGRGRIVREDGALLTGVLHLTGPSQLGPRLAHDPVRNEWMLVWLASGNIEKGEPAYGVKARTI